MQRTTTTVLAVTGVLLASSALWYAVLMRWFYDRPHGSWVSVSREDPSVAFIVGSFVALAALVVVAVEHVRRSRPGLIPSIAAGVLVGLAYILPTSLYYFGSTDILTAEVMMMDIGWHVIEEGIGGATAYFLLTRLTAPARQTQTEVLA